MCVPNQGHFHQKLIWVPHVDVHGLLPGLGQGEKGREALAHLLRGILSLLFFCCSKGKAEPVLDKSLLPALRPLLKAAKH